MIRTTRIILALSIAPLLHAIEEKTVPVGDTTETKEVVFTTPTGANVDDKKLTLQGAGPAGTTPDSTKTKMTSGITIPDGYDASQWAAGDQTGLTHTYLLSAAKSTTPLAVVIKGDIEDTKPITVPGTGGGTIQRGLTKFTVMAPYAAEVTSETLLSAQDGNTPSSRLTVGVGEEVRFTVGRTHIGFPSVSSAGGQVYITAGQQLDGSETDIPTATDTFIFRAPGTEQTSSVTLTFAIGGDRVFVNGHLSPLPPNQNVTKSVTIPITVIKPTGEKVSRHPGIYPTGPGKPDPALQPGVAAAGMYLRYTVLYKDAYSVLRKGVSFANVEVCELGGATDGKPQEPITGYFASINQAIPGVLIHDPTPGWIQYNPDAWIDKAAWNERKITIQRNAQQEAALKAYCPGKFHWRIPVRWRARVPLNIEHDLYTRIQTFEMKDTRGTVTVTKNDNQGSTPESVTRTP